MVVHSLRWAVGEGFSVTVVIGALLQAPQVCDSGLPTPLGRSLPTCTVAQLLSTWRD